MTKPKPVSVVPLRPLGRYWLRGPAWLEGDFVVMDCSRATNYLPERVRVYDTLMRVWSPSDAVKFATTFGLLERSMSDPAFPVGSQEKEPTSLYVDTAARMRGIVHAYQDVRDAQAGDDEAFRRVRDSVLKRERTDNRTILIAASDRIALKLNDGLVSGNPALGHPCPYVFDTAEQGLDAAQPGQLRIGILCESLLQTCYLQLAYALVDRVPIRKCRGCDTVFVASHGNSEFHSSRCGSTFRKREERRRQGRTSNGKATR